MPEAKWVEVNYYTGQAFPIRVLIPHALPVYGSQFFRSRMALGLVCERWQNGCGEGAAAMIKGEHAGWLAFFQPARPAWLPGSPACPEIHGGFLENAGTMCSLMGFTR